MDQYGQAKVYNNKSEENCKQAASDWSNNLRKYSYKFETTNPKYCASIDPIPEAPKPNSSSLCTEITNVYSIVGKHTRCQQNNNGIQNAINNTGNFSAATPHIVMNNGIKIYIDSDVPKPINALTADGVSYQDKNGFIIYIDINGSKGKGLLYDDVFPFYLTLSGKTIPAYPMDTTSYTQEALAKARTQHAGGDSNDHLSLNVIYDDFSEGHKTKLIMRSTNFRAAACATGYVNINSDYCQFGSGAEPRKMYNVCDTSNPSNIEHNCRFLVQKPFRFFR